MAVRRKQSVGKSRSAVQILDECIADIEAGRWTCHDLIEPNVGGSKPIGCAIGLVGINSGQAKLFYYNVEGEEGEVCDASMTYPAVGTPWPKSAQKAISALADTASLTKEKKANLAGGRDANTLLSKLTMDTEVVIEFNDAGSKNGQRITKKRALAWFQRARDTLTNG